MTILEFLLAWKRENEKTKRHKASCEKAVGILHGWNNQNKKKISLGSILLLLAILGYNIKIVDIITILSKIL